MCHRPSVSGLDRLEEAGTLAQELGVDPIAMVHTKMAGVEVTEDVVEDLDSPGPHRTHRRIDRGAVTRVLFGVMIMLDVTSMCDSL